MDKEKLNKWNREYYQKRKEEPEYRNKRRESARKYYSNHKTECSVRRKKYSEKNKEKYREYRRNWRVYTPEGIFSSLKTCTSNRKRNIEFNLNKKDFVKWWNSQEKICYYCKRSIEDVLRDNDKTKIRAKRLTIDRVDNNKGYEINNIVLCCYRCNSIKGDYFTKEEMLKIGKIINDRAIHK